MKSRGDYTAEKPNRPEFTEEEAGRLLEQSAEDKGYAFMEYSGYRGEIQYSEADRIYYGSILGITDMVTFEGDNVEMLRKSFHEAVDDYLETCRRHGKQPQNLCYS